MSEIIKQDEDICPKCKSDEWVYHYDSGESGTTKWWKGYCDQCRLAFTDHYTIKYSNTTFEEITDV